MILIEIRQRGAVPGVMKRELNKLLKAAWQATGEYWHAQYRSKHFTHAGAAEYGYDKRQGERGNPGEKNFRRSYTGRKLKRFGHTLPLVYTGASRTLSQIRDVRASRHGARVVINAPTLSFRKGKLALGKSMREEMTTVSAPERRMLIKIWERAFESNLGKLRNETTERV